jgi:hypothetical protein
VPPEAAQRAVLAVRALPEPAVLAVPVAARAVPAAPAARAAKRLQR